MSLDNTLNLIQEITKPTNLGRKTLAHIGGDLAHFRFKKAALVANRYIKNRLLERRKDKDHVKSGAYNGGLWEYNDKDGPMHHIAKPDIDRHLKRVKKLFIMHDKLSDAAIASFNSAKNNPNIDPQELDKLDKKADEAIDRYHSVRRHVINTHRKYLPPINNDI